MKEAAKDRKIDVRVRVKESTLRRYFRYNERAKNVLWVLENWKENLGLRANARRLNIDPSTALGLSRRYRLKTRA